jgi:hypothetical protein
MQVDAAAIVRAVSTVPGVAAARVDDDRRDGAEASSVLATLQVTLAPGADEGDVAAAVDAMVRKQFGVGVDPRRIDVLQEPAAVPRLRAVPPAPAEPDDSTPVLPPPVVSSPWPPAVPASPSASPEVLPAHGSGPEAATMPVVPADPGPEQPAETIGLALVRPRLAIHRVQVTSSPLSYSATVWLRHDADEYTGTASGPATPAGVQRAVVAATVGAVQGAVDAAFLRHHGEEVRIDPEAVEITGVGGSRVAVVQVSLATAAGHQRLTGAAEVNDDVRQALVRATLDAMNRRLETLLDPR